MENVFVNKKQLQILLDYIMQDQQSDYEQCKSEDWSEEELELHIFAIALNLQITVENQEG